MEMVALDDDVKVAMVHIQQMQAAVNASDWSSDIKIGSLLILAEAQYHAMHEWAEKDGRPEVIALRDSVFTSLNQLRKVYNSLYAQKNRTG